jgi:hypothetical protein
LKSRLGIAAILIICMCADFACAQWDMGINRRSRSVLQCVPAESQIGLNRGESPYHENSPRRRAP